MFYYRPLRVIDGRVVRVYTCCTVRRQFCRLTDVIADSNFGQQANCLV